MLSLENDASRRWRVKLACSSFLLLIAVFLITMWMTTPEIKTDPFLLNQENWPATVEEAVHDILPRITPYEKLEMMVTNKDHLNSMHFGIGFWLRKNCRCAYIWAAVSATDRTNRCCAGPRSLQHF